MGVRGGRRVRGREGRERRRWGGGLRGGVGAGGLRGPGGMEREGAREAAIAVAAGREGRGGGGMMGRERRRGSGAGGLRALMGREVFFWGGVGGRCARVAAVKALEVDDSEVVLAIGGGSMILRDDGGVWPPAVRGGEIWALAAAANALEPEDAEAVEVVRAGRVGCKLVVEGSLRGGGHAFRGNGGIGAPRPPPPVFCGLEE